MISTKKLELIFAVTLQLYYRLGLAQTVNLTIPDGNIQGLIGTTTRNNITYFGFQGIPFAQPPLGSLRFANPVKNSPWHGTYDATYPRSECVQSDGVLSTSVSGKEDCLYISVFSPNLNATNLPVLVWIYGGAFLTGNSSSDGPDYFLEQGLVFVSFNYRLGIFGFLSTEDEVFPGNWGIKDQILALKWVQENIAYFGGDPNSVTIFGESAGAVSVHLLMQTNLTQGLFHRAIMNSGTTLNLWGLNVRSSFTARTIGTNLGIVTLDNNILVDTLREVDAVVLQRTASLASWGIFLTNGLSGLPFAPTMEPNVSGAVYLNPSDSALRDGKFHKVPVLMGLNSNEAVAAEGIPSFVKLYLTYYDISVNLLPPYSMTSDVIKRSGAGIEIKQHYFTLGSVTLASDVELANFISADQFNRPIRRAASDMSEYTTVYFYEFGHQGSIGGGNTRRGTGHAEDLEYLFNRNKTLNAVDTNVSEKLVLLWSNFAKYGNPTPERDERLDNVIWNPMNKSSGDFTYMSINETLVESVNPEQSDWEFYTYLWDKYGTNDEITTY